MLHLHRFLRPSRLNAITRLYFFGVLIFPPNVTRFKKRDHYDESWIGVWNSIALFGGLQHLPVQIYIFGDTRHWTQVEDEILEPIRKVMVPQVFELFLPFPENSEGKVAKELSCRIIRSRESLG